MNNGILGSRKCDNWSTYYRQISETHTFIFSPSPNPTKMMKSIQTKVSPTKWKREQEGNLGKESEEVVTTCLQREGTNAKGGDPPDCSGATFLRKRGR